jgi:hypothetical protein
MFVDGEHLPQALPGFMGSIKAINLTHIFSSTHGCLRLIIATHNTCHIGTFSIIAYVSLFFFFLWHCI